MLNEFECTKIKDGLYLGNIQPAHVQIVPSKDLEFLLINKFYYIINCSAQVPNIFDEHGINYLKFKLVNQKAHHLWQKNMKKLQKIQKFISECQEHSLCCFIFSANGNNRSLVMLASYLMAHYRWSVGKTLQFIRSKNIFIGLSQHYILQLQILEEFLKKQGELSNSWKGPFKTAQEQLLSKTFLNSLECPVEITECKKIKKLKRITWANLPQSNKKKKTKSKKYDLKEPNVNKQKNMHLQTKNQQEKYLNSEIPKAPETTNDSKNNPPQNIWDDQMIKILKGNLNVNNTEDKETQNRKSLDKMSQKLENNDFRNKKDAENISVKNKNKKTKSTTEFKNPNKMTQIKDSSSKSSSNLNKVKKTIKKGKSQKEKQKSLPFKTNKS